MRPSSPVTDYVKLYSRRCPRELRQLLKIVAAQYEITMEEALNIALKKGLVQMQIDRRR